jgi:predicted nucleic acid-binding protein
MSFVLDASVTAAWCFPDETSQMADAALNRLSDDEALTPGLWWAEIRNILVVSERRGRIDATDTDRFLADLSRLPIATDNDPIESTVFELARSHDLTIYDALYLELATRHALPLATLDRRLAAACGQAGVPLVGGATQR